ncbi:hypothetical protein M127_5364 [Bacteroides fragilis str. S6L5]|nr:hypothetical protein M127_5364 [Bacteroides fragilis str. S6L5]
MAYNSLSLFSSNLLIFFNSEATIQQSVVKGHFVIKRISHAKEKARIF